MIYDIYDQITPWSESVLFKTILTEFVIVVLVLLEVLTMTRCLFLGLL